MLNSLSNIAKLRLLLTMFKDRPTEFFDRLTAIFQVQLNRLETNKPEMPITNKDEVFYSLEKIFQTDILSYINGKNVLDFQKELRHRIKTISETGPFTLQHNADFSLGLFCYAICRAVKPENVIETGVAYGVTSSFILLALHENNKGKLTSIDLPPLGDDADKFVGALIPNHLRDRWKLIRAASKRVLPELLTSMQNINIFIHDSLHTTQNMRFEFEIAYKHLASDGLLISDDIDLNFAFMEFVTNHEDLRYWAAIKEVDKNGIFGVSVI